MQEMQETRVQSLCGEDPLEKEMATHSRILAWEVPWIEESGSYSPWGCKRVGHNLATKQQQPSLWSSSHLYMTAGKTMALTIQTFVDKVMSLIFNVLSKFVIAFLPGSQHLLISWLWSTSTMILESKKIKSVTASTFSPSICIK